MKSTEPTAAKPRGRPRAFSEDDALDRMIGVFWTKGFAAASLDELAMAAGIKRPSLYAAFGDKRALYLKALARYREKVADGLAQTMQKGLPLREGLMAFYAAAIELYTTGADHPRGCMISASASDVAPEDMHVRAFLAETYGQIEAALTHRFAQEIARGGLRPDASASTLASLAAGLLYRTALNARAGVPPAELEATARAAIEALLSR